MLKPRKLRPGDRVAAVTLSWGGPGTFPDRYEAGKQQLAAAFGLELLPARHALRDAAWVDAHPEARAADLLESFADPSIRGIIATIGGDDSLRLLPFLDLAVIRANPKVFLGFSDTTVTHFACYQAGLGSFYGPSIMAGFGENGGLFPYMVDSVRRSLFVSAPPGRVAPNAAGWTAEMRDWADPANQAQRRTLQPATGWRWLQGHGSAEGHLLGGCLEVLDWLRGTPLWPDPAAWDGAILFLETSEDAPPPVAVRYFLRSLAAMGVLARLAGILVGRPGGAVLPARFGDYDAAVLQVVTTEQGLAALPVVTGMDFGHTDPVFVLPLGVQARLDCERQAFSIVESAVTE